ncbi:outer membrane protein assembly factor BamB [Tahibacter aquaticus]|uniref:Outer membrane protein assembly factor BamB n=1 Tax=Tahibacter aquaticus TaxID=520092 RepID=A0A4R6YT15_9GAMM|nr:PQQ-binding-like beta-propeller repeat protein [Tahibacter aquaticus]TDR41232.1 outer membrane protein assembly factor BamB [Tahibacter aquaticus]
MQPNLPPFFRLAALALLGSLSAGAGAQTLPQWTRELKAYVPTDEYLYGWRSWAATGDGGSVFASRNMLGPILRRFEADGGLRFEQIIQPDRLPLQPYSLNVAIVAVDPASAAMYALLGGPADSGTAAIRHCNLLRYSSQGVRELSLAVPPANGGAGDCLELAVAADGSLIVLRERALLRLASDGSLLWQNATVNARSTDGPSLLIDAQQRIVIANNTAPGASVARYSLDGALLDAAAVPDTGSNTVLGLDLLPNDDVIVSGKMDLPGDFSQTGFVSRWSSAGALQLLNAAYTDTPYLRSVHDAAGNLFVLTGQNTVRAIDPLSGQLRWEQPASAMAARPDGVLLLADGNSTVTAVDAAGIAGWTHTLSAQDIRFASGSSDPNLAPRLLLQSGDSTPACGRGPEVLSFTASGAVAQRQKVCSIESGDEVYQLDAVAGGGVGVLSQSRMRALDPAGIQQWEFDNCYISCGDPGDVRTLVSRMLADGGAWLLNEQVRAPYARTLLRLSADGSVVQAFNVPPPLNRSRAAALVADADEAVVLQSANKDLRWVRFTRTGGLREIRDYDLPGLSAGNLITSFATPPRRLAGGDIVLAYSHRLQCAFMLCYRPNSMLLRLAADGSLRWQYELPQSTPFAGFNDDGSAIAINLGAEAAQTRIVAIDAQGMAAPAQLPGFRISQAIGPSHGNYLLYADGVHYRMDAVGVLAATDIPYASTAYLAVGEAGFLLDAQALGADAVLLDPLSLATYAAFDIDGVANPPSLNYAYQWTMADDGSIYAASYLEHDSAPGWSARSRVSRFAAPGWIAADRIHADGFE